MSTTSTNVTRCAVCNVAASLKCIACKQVYYCGKDHQKIDWKNGHKRECKCYEIVKNELLGRHLRATRDIKIGEIILRESPLIYGPKIASFPVCLGCHRKLSTPHKNYYKCSKCSWPLCGMECENSDNHRDECNLMFSRKFSAHIDYNKDDEDMGKKNSAYCVILPLRCILLRQKSPSLYEKFVSLEDHLAERINTPLYNVLKVNLITFIQKVLGIDDLSEEDILKVAAILDTNAFEVRQGTGENKLRAIYPLASMISHDCISNVRHTFDEKMQIVFLAKTAIVKGDIIATSYTQPLKSTIMRRQHLLQAKCFDCTCTRCQDPTELNTYAGAIICIKCKIGKIISTNPMDNNANWHCQHCHHQLSSQQIILGNAAIQKEIDSLDKTSPTEFEEFLERYKEILHENHTYILQMKYALSQMYGNISGFMLNDMNDELIQRKIELCQDLLKIANTIDGGYSLFRGKLLLELQDAVVVQSKRQYLNGVISHEENQEKLKEAMQMLKECCEIMKLESDTRLSLQERCKLLTKDINNDKA